MAHRAGSPRARLAAQRALGWPARRVLDRRVRWVLDAFEERVGETTGQLSLHQRLDLIEAELRRVTRTLGESLLERRLATLATEDDAAVPADTARFLNWAEGWEGPAARAGLWFNPPVAVEYGQDAVEVLLVNERIVEQPYVFAALADTAGPARILDVGGAESTVGLSLASLGHEVHVVDPRGYSLEHPGLRVHPMPLDELPPALRFDAAVALSSIEHFGLGAYGGGDEGARLDRVALERIHDLLAPGGKLVLTVPCGASSSQDGFQRTYSVAELRGLLSGWEVLDLSVAWRQDRFTWVQGTTDDPGGEIGVALVTALRGAAGANG